MYELALFAGAGGGLLGGRLLGWRTVCAVEINDYARNVLLARQSDGTIEPFPIWDDVASFDGRPWAGLVDVVSGGFPCQDIAVGSATKTGIEGERSGLWYHMWRIIGEVGPRFVLVENSAALTTRGLGRVLGDLATLGYDARWGVLGAVHAGAPHERERIWIVAHSNKVMGPKRTGAVKQQGQPADVARINGTGAKDRQDLWVEMASEIHRMDDGVASKLERTEALGNGQVPAVVALAWHLLAPKE
jgi:DNA (cytosine-5)-methyltransferase 1